MTTKSKVILTIVILLSAFAFGRFTAPEHVKIETKVVEVEKKTDKVDKQNHKKTTTVTEIKPDGTKKITSVTTDESETKSLSKEETDKMIDKSKEVTTSTSKVTLSALAGVNPFKLQNGVDYGMSATKPILGPVTIGVFGFKSGTAGASVGLTF